MKRRWMIGMVLVVLMATVACAYAADATFKDGYKFTVPDNYTVYEQSDEFINLHTDYYHIISVYLHKGLSNSTNVMEYAAFGLEKQGYNITGCQTFQYNGKDIIEVDYENEVGQYHGYAWEVDNGVWVFATYGHPKNESADKWDSSPVKTIFNSLVKI